MEIPDHTRADVKHTSIKMVVYGKCFSLYISAALTERHCAQSRDYVYKTPPSIIDPVYLAGDLID